MKVTRSEVVAMIKEKKIVVDDVKVGTERMGNMVVLIMGERTLNVNQATLISHGVVDLAEKYGEKYRCYFMSPDYFDDYYEPASGFVEKGEEVVGHGDVHFPVIIEWTDDGVRVWVSGLPGFVPMTHADTIDFLERNMAEVFKRARNG